MSTQLLDDFASAYLDMPLRPQTSFIAYAQEVDHLDNEDASSFWRKLLRGSAMTPLRTNLNGSVDAKNTPDQTLYRRIPRLPPLRNTTFAAALHAAWALSMALETHCRDIVFITVVSGRSIAFPGADTVMGPCPNVVPVRFALQSLPDAEKTRSPKPQQRYVDVVETYAAQQAAGLRYETTPFSSVCVKSTDWPFPPPVGALVNHTTEARGDVFASHAINHATTTGGDAEKTEEDRMMRWKVLPMVEQRGRCGVLDVYLHSRLMEGGEEGVTLALQYNPAAVEGTRAMRLLDGLCKFLERIGRFPEEEVCLDRDEAGAGAGAREEKRI